jgi:hypothetical protein
LGNLAAHWLMGMKVVAMVAAVGKELEHFDLVPGTRQRRIDRLVVAAGLQVGGKARARQGEAGNQRGKQQGDESLHEKSPGKKALNGIV